MCRQLTKLQLTSESEPNFLTGGIQDVVCAHLYQDRRS